MHTEGREVREDRGACGRDATPASMAAAVVATEGWRKGGNGGTKGWKSSGVV